MISYKKPVLASHVVNKEGGVADGKIILRSAMIPIESYAPLGPPVLAQKPPIGFVSPFGLALAMPMTVVSLPVPSR
jgi:hypothetical protein